jgi:transaldolase
MKFFVDTADVNEIRELAGMGLLDGVTTNPSLVMKNGRPFPELIAEICACVSGPVSAEVTATAADGMVAEGRKLAAIADNVAIKVPLTWDGLKACRVLTGEGHMVNVTLCFSANQALLAARAGATFVSPFIGRLQDAGQDGVELIHECVAIFETYHLPTQVLAASIRGTRDVTDVALAGAHIATLPPDVLFKMIDHPLTDVGIQRFLADAAKYTPV